VLYLFDRAEYGELTTSRVSDRGVNSEARIRVQRIIIIHLLGLAPAGYLTAPDNGA
jgi:hypothetical protein